MSAPTDGTGVPSPLASPDNTAAAAAPTAYGPAPSEPTGFGPAWVPAQTYPSAPNEPLPYGTIPPGAGRESRFGESATAALVLGIAAFLTGLVPFVGAILGVMAIVYALIALAHALPKGKAITGLALGAVGLVASTLLTVGSLWVLANWETVAPLMPQSGVFGSEAPSQTGDRSNGAESVDVDVSGVPEGDYAALDDESFAALVDDPGAAYDERFLVHGEVQYLDESGGECAAMVLIDDARQDSWEDYQIEAWVYPTVRDGSCGGIADLADLDHVKLWVRGAGTTTTEWEDGGSDEVLALEADGYQLLTALP